MADNWASTDDHAPPPQAGGWASTDEQADAGTPGFGQQLLQETIVNPARQVGAGLLGASASANRITANIFHLLDQTADAISRTTGMSKGGAFKAVEDWARSGQQSQEQQAAQLAGGRQDFPSQLYRGAAQGVAELPSYVVASSTPAGPVAGMAALGAIRESDQGWQAALKAAAEGGLTGGALTVMGPASRPIRLTGAAAMTYAQSRLNGADNATALANATTMGLMSGARKGGVPATEILKQIPANIPAVNTAMESTAQALRRSALRGGYTVKTPYEQVYAAADAMRGKPLTEEGLAQVQAETADLQQQKMQGLAEAEQQRGAAVPRSAVIQGLQDLRAQYEDQPLKKRDLRQIDAAIQEVQDTYPEQIPATKAEAIKEGLTWKEGKPPELQATAASENKIAAVIRNILPEWVPEITEINRSQQANIWLEGFMKPAINKLMLKPGFISQVSKVGLTKAVAGALTNPLMQSHLAILINRAQQLNPAKWGAPSMAMATARAAKIAEDVGDAGAETPAEPTAAAPPAAPAGSALTIPVQRINEIGAEAAFQEQMDRIRAAAKRGE